MKRSDTIEKEQAIKKGFRPVTVACKPDSTFNHQYARGRKETVVWRDWLKAEAERISKAYPTQFVMEGYGSVALWAKVPGREVGKTK